MIPSRRCRIELWSMGAFLFSTGASRALTIVRPSSYEDRNDQQKMQQDNMGADIPFRKWSLVCNE